MSSTVVIPKVLATDGDVRRNGLRLRFSCRKLRSCRCGSLDAGGVGAGHAEMAFGAARPPLELTLFGSLRSVLSSEELEEKVAIAYTAHFGKAGLVQWDRFTCTDVQEIVRCMGPHVLSRICELLARQFRHRRSGLPDLLVWNPETGKAKAAEVKGPGDTLSPKQVVWLRELLAMGVDCEVCRVTATSSKRLQRKKAGAEDARGCSEQTE
ncbi:hypothetical protein MRX96_021973 [Rhipicephalus microplus]